MAVQKNFVVKNGIEVNTNLIIANTSSNKVGIATTVVNYTLDVNGTIGSKNSVVSGFSTVNNVTINGRISAGSSLGATGQYLVSTGAGVTWASIPRLRTVDTQTASVGVATFITSYTVGLLDVYINGVRLSDDEFTAVDAATVVLDDPCFGGETVEFVSYSPTGVGAGFTGIQGLTILDEGTPVGSALQVTSLNFVGTSVTAVGAGYGVTVYLSDYIPSSGISTNVIGGIASVTSVTAGIITATDGFISVGNTTPIKISLIGNKLTFTAVGIGSTTLTLF